MSGTRLDCLSARAHLLHEEFNIFGVPVHAHTYSDLSHLDLTGEHGPHFDARVVKCLRKPDVSQLAAHNSHSN